MRTVAVVNLKGGVGKSTTAINMALIMSQAHGKNVLLIDNDFQAAVTKFFGKHSYDKPSMEDVLRNPMLSAEDVIIPSGRWGLDIIPANMNMIAAADDLITDKDSDQIGRIRNILNQVEEEYDYCIIDCHPSVEEIATGCFDESLSRCKENGSEIKALWNHDTSRPLGSTKTDTLRFNMGDTTGLNYDIDLPNNTWGNDVRESVKRGDVDGSSFGFICLEDKWSKVQHEGEEMYKRSVVKAELLEVSPCTFPAYDSSQINCRSFERMKADTKEEKRLEELRKEARLLEIADENNKE